ncbi:MAG: DUF4268 domain-containing protein [Candidatus Pacearchaeota archaeon]
MATEIKLWQVEGGKLVPSEISMAEAKRTEVNDLEKWIKSNSEILGNDIALIGEQIMTKRGPLDFLGIDRSGNLVIIELKRDKLHREALAQAIDYASDLSSWDYDKLNPECEKFTGKSIYDVLRENFDLEESSLEEISFNNAQKILLVGTGVDESLQRMVEWLSDKYDISINVLILKYTKTKRGDEILARTTIIPEEVEQEKMQKHQKKIYAEKNNVRKEFWEQLLEKINKKSKLFSRISPSVNHWISAGSGKSGITYNFVILNSYAGCELYLDRGKDYLDPNVNKIRFDKLLENKQEIEDKFGKPLDWERLDEKRASRIAIRFPNMSLNDKDHWGDIQEELVEHMIKLESAFRKYIGELE